MVGMVSVECGGVGMNTKRGLMEREGEQVIHKTNTHQPSNPLFLHFFVVIACLFSLSCQNHKHTNTTQCGCGKQV